MTRQPKTLHDFKVQMTQTMTGPCDTDGQGGKTCEIPTVISRFDVEKFDGKEQTVLRPSLRKMGVLGGPCGASASGGACGACFSHVCSESIRGGVHRTSACRVMVGGGAHLTSFCSARSPYECWSTPSQLLP